MTTGPGRPKISWTEDDDRFRLALIWANSAHSRLELNPRLSERAAANNIAFLERTKMTPAEIKKARKHGWLDVPSHAKDADGYMDARGETLRKKFRRLKSDVESAGGQDTGDYFGALALAIVATVAATDYVRAFNTAWLFAALAGEDWWFLNRLAPIIKERFDML